MKIENKNKLLFTGFFFVLIVGYSLSISDTLELKSNYKGLIEEEQIFTNVPRQLQRLKSKEKYYDSLMSHYQISEASLQNSLLKSVEKYTSINNLKVLSFNKPHVINKNQRIISSYAFAVSGTYKNILDLTYHLEQKSKFGKIANLRFEKKKDYKTQKETLEGYFVLQLIQ
jgi:hypothetical protein